MHRNAIFMYGNDADFVSFGGLNVGSERPKHPRWSHTGDPDPVAIVARPPPRMAHEHAPEAGGIRDAGLAADIVAGQYQPLTPPHPNASETGLSNATRLSRVLQIH